jgi:hypothetical protein
MRIVLKFNPKICRLPVDSGGKIRVACRDNQQIHAVSPVCFNSFFFFLGISREFLRALLNRIST